MITPSASISAVKNEVDYANVFSTYYRPDNEAKAIAKALTGNKRVVLFLDDDPFFQDLSGHFKKI